jgi:hypothetical protein
MSKLEVQYAVRVPDPTEGWRVLPERYAWRGLAARSAHARGPRAEVVAQVVMVAGDWTDPDRAEEVVRRHREHEQHYEQALGWFTGPRCSRCSSGACRSRCTSRWWAGRDRRRAR